MGWILYTVVVLAALYALCCVGYAFARTGAPQGVVKLVMLPGYTLFGNIFGVMPFIILGWVFAALTGNTDMANYVVGKTSELAMLSSLFGDPITVPVWHIVLYQLGIWLFFTRPIADACTSAVYAAAGAESAR